MYFFFVVSWLIVYELNAERCEKRLKAQGLGLKACPSAGGG